MTVIGIPLTLAMMQIAAGDSVLPAAPANRLQARMLFFRDARIGVDRGSEIVAAVMPLGGHLVLTYTRFGRYV